MLPVIAISSLCRPPAQHTLSLSLSFMQNYQENCSFGTVDHILSLFYIFFLVLFVSAMSVKSKHIKDNYREGSYIFVLMLLKIPIWLTWIISSVILPEGYHNVCFGELQVTSHHQH